MPWVSGRLVSRLVRARLRLALSPGYRMMAHTNKHMTFKRSYVFPIVVILAFLLITLSYKIGQRYDDCVVHWRDVTPTQKAAFGETPPFGQQVRHEQEKRDVSENDDIADADRWENENEVAMMEYRTSSVPPRSACPNTEICNGYPVTLNEPVNLCSTESQPSVILLIVSELGQGMLRDAIRRSWAAAVSKRPGTKIKHVFLLATSYGHFGRSNSLQNEIYQNSDLLIFSFHDAPPLVTLKILSGMKWIVSQCDTVDFVLRIDTGTFANTPKWESYLRQPHLVQSLRTSWFGNCPLGARPVVRDPTHALYVPQSLYPAKTFPRYCDSSHGYGIGRELIIKILIMARNVTYVPFDDSFLGIACEKIKLNSDVLLDIPNFSVPFDEATVRSELLTHACEYINGHFTWRNVPWEKMESLATACTTQ